MIKCENCGINFIRNWRCKVNVNLCGSKFYQSGCLHILYRKLNRERAKKWAKLNKEKKRRLRARWNSKHRNKCNAHQAIRRAILSGKLQRPAICEKCQIKTIVEAHHMDYSKPLDVKWLCKHCHVQADKERKALTKK